MLQNDEAEDGVRVLDCVHVVAQGVSDPSELGTEAEVATASFSLGPGTLFTRSFIRSMRVDVRRRLTLETSGGARLAGRPPPPVTDVPGCSVLTP